MSELTPDFKALFQANYGLSYQSRNPDYSRCCMSVRRPMGHTHIPGQCARKNGHGPHGAYCKQHDPEEVKRRDQERSRKYESEMYPKRMNWHRQKWADELKGVLQEIAAGHNDPRALAQDIITRMESEAPEMPEHMRLANKEQEQ